MAYKLSILTTTYNQEKFIAQALDGFVMQKTNFPFQVIISDDCSTDKTREIIKKYQKKYPEIIKPIFREKNLGPMDNFIETLNVADTEYVALCDGDDFWTDELKLQKQVDFLDKHKDYNICFHQTIIFFEDGSRKDEIYPYDIPETTTFEDVLKGCYMPANSVVYRWKFRKKDSFKSKFPKNIVPGDYYVHMLHACDGKVKFIEEVMSKYRRHDGGMWWLTSSESQSVDFHLKYGLKFINFYDAAEKEFDLDSSVFGEIKQHLLNETIKSLIIKKRWNELKQVDEKYGDAVSNYINSLSNEPFYNNFSKFKRVFYFFIFEPKIFWGKLLNKFISILKKIKNAIYYLFRNPKKFIEKIKRKIGK